MLNVITNKGNVTQTHKLFCITNEGRTIREEAAREVIEQIYSGDVNVEVYSGIKLNDPEYFVKNVGSDDAVVYHDNISKRTWCIKGDELKRLIELIKTSNMRVPKVIKKEVENN